MEVVPIDVDRLELPCWDLPAGRIFAAIYARLNDQSALRRRVSNEVHDSLERAQWPTAPVHRDERKQSVLNLVPLAGARREMADVNRHVELVGESLELDLPRV